MNDHTTEIKRKEKEKDGTEANEEREETLTLPDELIISFASYLAFLDILNLSRVNSQLLFLATDSQLWRFLVIRDFFHAFSEQYQRELLNNPKQDWKKLYRDEIKRKVSNIPPKYRNIFFCAYVGDVINLSRLLNDIIETEKLDSDITWIIAILSDNETNCLLEIAAANNDLQLIITLLDYIIRDENRKIYLDRILYSFNIEEKAICSLKIAMKNGNLEIALEIIDYFNQHRNEYQKSLDDLLKAVYALDPTLSSSTISQSLKFLLENKKNNNSNLEWIKKARSFPEAERYLVKAYGEEEFKKMAIIEAIMQNDDEYVKHLVEIWGVKLNTSKTTISPLYYSIRQANIPLTEYLIAQGADNLQRSGILLIYAALESGSLSMFRWIFENLEQTELANNINRIIKEILKKPPENLNPLFLISLVRELTVKEIIVADENNPSIKILEESVERLNEKISQGISSAINKKEIMDDFLRFAKEFAGIISTQNIFKAWYQDFREKNPGRYPLLELTEEKYSENKYKFYSTRQGADEKKQDEKILSKLNEFMDKHSISLINELIENEKSEKLNSKNNQNKTGLFEKCTIS